jgi:hypothetical protein
LNFDDRGLCYASPLPDNEIPPLPTYIEAVQMPQNSFLQKQRDSLTTSASAEDVESSPPGDTKQFSLSEEEEVSIV